MKNNGIIIKDSNAERIEALLKRVQGKHSTHTIGSYAHLLNLIYAARRGTPWEEGRLTEATLYIKVGAGHFSGAYNYPAMGTCVTISYSAKGDAKLTNAYMADIRRGKPYIWTLVATMAAHILRQYNAYILPDKVD